jgi:hypothetical protein
VIRSDGADERRKVTGDMRQVYARQIPKAPKMTGNIADWDYMTFKWFFNLRENPSFYPADSPQSIDIANSYSVQELKKEYFATGVMPDSWTFTGPGSATGRYGEVEWFIGSYAVEDFQLKDGIATFKVRNCSCWHSGTRLPMSWTNEIERFTSRRITVLVSEPPTGKKLHKQIIHRFPAAGRIPGFSFIMHRLPTFGRDWEQVYEIRMEWQP